MIKISGVSKSYDKSFKAVDNISLEVKPAEIFGFLGPNGAGKTTTLKMISGILEPDEGDITINGINIKSDPVKAKFQFGYVPDNPNAFLRLKGHEYLNFMADVYNVPMEKRKDRIIGYAHKMEIEDALDSKIQSYSHGMRQKLVLIGAILHDPAVWILDEPLTGLDPKSSYFLKEMMKEHTGQGKTVFFSTHVLDVAERICDRVAIIDQGKILFCGSLEEMKNTVKQEGTLENMFLKLTGEIDER